MKNLFFINLFKDNTINFTNNASTALWGGGIPVSLETIVFKINMLSYIINLTKIKIWKIPKIARSCRFRRNCKSSLFAAPSLKTRFPTHIEEQFLPQAQSIRNVFSIFNILIFQKTIYSYKLQFILIIFQVFLMYILYYIFSLGYYYIMIF